jgi:hypothetical protein
MQYGRQYGHCGASPYKGETANAYAGLTQEAAQVSWVTRASRRSLAPEQERQDC